MAAHEMLQGCRSPKNLGSSRCRLSGSSIRLLLAHGTSLDAHVISHSEVVENLPQIRFK